MSEHDNQCGREIEKKLPMSEDQLKAALAKVKNAAFATFKEKVLGDINNVKGQEYVEKMKKAFKTKYDQIKKKNSQFMKDQCFKVLEECFN